MEPLSYRLTAEMKRKKHKLGCILEVGLAVLTDELIHSTDI